MDIEIINAIIQTSPQFMFAVVIAYMCQKTCNAHERRMAEVHRNTLKLLKEILTKPGELTIDK